MYAVIQTGGKQYRVRPGDLLVVDKLEGEPGAVVAFDRVLLIGEGDAVTVGAPIVAGASVSATLVETRKAKKIKVFKKIRRQGYRRTRGHRQLQSVLRVTALEAGDRREAWDGEVNLTPLSVLNARARNLARGMEAAQARTSTPATHEAAGAGPKAKPAAPASERPAKKAAKPATSPKAAAPKKPVGKTTKGAAPSKKAPKAKADPAAPKKAAAAKTAAKKPADKKPKKAKPSSKG
jgi:large subunit ribosomal protein L21